MTTQAKPDAKAPEPEAPALVVADTPEALLTAALAKAQGEFPAIAKTKTAKVNTKAGAEYSYSYADLADVLTAVRPALAGNGLAVVQRTVREGANVILVTDLKHVGGGKETSEVDLGRGAGDPQAFGGALTYLRRYELTTLLGLSPEDDRDGHDVPAASAPAALPNWALAIQAQAAKAAFMDDLKALVGDDRAKIIAKEGAQAYGGIPGVAADLVKAIRAAAAPSTAPAPEADAERQAQDAAAEAGDPPPVNEALPPSEPPTAPASPADTAWATTASYERLKAVAGAGADADPGRRRAAQDELERRDAEDAAAAAGVDTSIEPGRPLPATIAAPELPADPAKATGTLKAAGCICDDPLNDGFSDTCPIIGHGIAF